MISVHKFHVLRYPHCPSSPKGSAAHTRDIAEGDPAHESEDFWAAAEAIPERKGLIQELFTGIKSLLQSRREAFKNSSDCSLPHSYRSGESKRLIPLSCYPCQDIQIIVLRLFFLQKTRPFPEYWLAIGNSIFITWVIVSEILQETGKCQKFFKGRLYETLGFHKTCTYLQETFCLVDSFQEAPEFFFIWVINHTPGAFWTGENTVLEYEHSKNEHNEKPNSVLLQ